MNIIKIKRGEPSWKIKATIEQVEQKSAKHAEKYAMGNKTSRIWPNDEFLWTGEQIEGNLVWRQHKYVIQCLHSPLLAQTLFMVSYYSRNFVINSILW